VINYSVFYQEAAEGRLLTSDCFSNNSFSFHHPIITLCSPWHRVTMKTYRNLKENLVAGMSVTLS